MQRHNGKRHSLFVMCLAGVPVCLYIYIIVSIPQNRDLTFGSERYSLAGPISNVFYGAPFGSAYSGVLDVLTKTEAESLHQALDELPKDKTDLGSLVSSVTDGNGFGYIFVATAAMRLFGVHDWSLPVLSVSLLILSAAIFLWRFKTRYATVVPLYFTSLMLLEFTPAVYASSAQFPLGGIRYFSLIGFIPACHICFEILRSKCSATVNTHLALGFQVIFLLLAASVRESAGSLLGAVVLVLVVVTWLVRRNSVQLRGLRNKVLGLSCAVALFWIAAILLVPHSYMQQGRTTTVFWHRAVVSLGVSPEWPFGDLKETINCSRDIPEGLMAGVVDRNGHCIWIDYAERHHLPRSAINSEIYGGTYEAVMRHTFFNILRNYPKEALEVFFYYKPLLLFNTIKEGFKVKIDIHPYLFILIIAISITDFYCINYFFSSAYESAEILSIGALLATLNLLPLTVAWAISWTIGDVFVDIIFCSGMVFILAGWAVRRAFMKMFTVSLHA